MRGHVLAAAAIALAAFAVAARAEECGTRLTPETAAAIEAQERAGAYVLREDLRPKAGARVQYMFQVPLAIHVVARSDGTGGLPDTSVTNTIARANTYYVGAGMQFFQQGAIDRINSDFFYDQVNTQARIDQLKGQNVVANAVNVYFTNSLADATGDLCGQASFTTDAVQGVVMSNGCTTNAGVWSTFAHELGHYFDLFHTHETQFGAECPDGSNCSTAGDKLCSTPADPTLSKDNVNGSCQYTGTAMACGQSYAPEVSNLMSYAVPKNCRDHFTLEQMNKALATLTVLRSNLISSQLAVTWVDFSWLGSQNGSFAFPYRTLGSAITATASGGTIVMRGGTTGERPTLTKPLRFDSFRYPTLIGP